MRSVRGGQGHSSRVRAKNLCLSRGALQGALPYAALVWRLPGGRSGAHTYRGSLFTLGGDRAVVAAVSSAVAFADTATGVNGGGRTPSRARRTLDTSYLHGCDQQ